MGYMGDQQGMYIVDRYPVSGNGFELSMFEKWGGATQSFPTHDGLIGNYSFWTWFTCWILDSKAISVDARCF